MHWHPRQEEPFRRKQCGRNAPATRRLHLAGTDKSPCMWIIDFRRRVDDSIARHAGGNQHLAIRQQSGCMVKARFHSIAGWHNTPVASALTVSTGPDSGSQDPAKRTIRINRGPAVRRTNCFRITILLIQTCRTRVFSSRPAAWSRDRPELREGSLVWRQWIARPESLTKGAPSQRHP
jgi:hypothetical protein